MSMSTLVQSLSLSALLAVAGMPVLAQEAAAPDATATEAAAPADPAAPTEVLEMGTEAPVVLTAETATVGQGYLASTMDQWEVRCEKAAEGTDPCQLFQLLKDADGNSVAEFSIFALPKGGKAAAGATVVVPLETLLTSNLTIAIDTAAAKVYPFTFCTQVGCVARIGFTGPEIDQFKKGAKATVTIVPAAAPEQKVDLAISLKGFTAGFDAVQASLPQ